jgi:hypothetical protein
MNKLAEVNAKDSQTALATAPTAKATKRLIAALAYTDGIRVETLTSGTISRVRPYTRGSTDSNAS